MFAEIFLGFFMERSVKISYISVFPGQLKEGNADDTDDYFRLFWVCETFNG